MGLKTFPNSIEAEEAVIGAILLKGNDIFTKCNGLGRLIFQYKQYPTLQSIYDYQTMKKFFDGNYSAADGVMRLTKTFYDSSKQAIFKDKTKVYNAKAQDVDREAEAMLRFLFTRVTASAISSMISVVPFLARALRGQNGTAWGVLRSGESPALGLLFRMFVWSSLITMNDDEDEATGAVGDMLKSFQFLLLPVLFSNLLDIGLSTIKKFGDED